MATLTEKEELKSDSNLIDRQGDVLVYFYTTIDSKGGVKGRIVFQYGPARVSTNPIKRANKDLVVKELAQFYTAMSIKHKDQLNNFNYVKEVILD